MDGDGATVQTAVVLAAGRGTRLGSLTANVPKPLLKVAGRPCIAWILGDLASAGIRRAVVVVGYRAEMLEEYLAANLPPGLSAICVKQKTPNGTGSAVRLAQPHVGDAPFLITFGDILIHPSSYANAVRVFTQSGCDLLMAVNWVDDPRAGAAIYMDADGWVTQVIEKPAPGTSSTHWNHAGLVVAKPVLFDYLERLSPSVRGEYELTAAYGPMVQDGLRLMGMPVCGYWGDVGTPADLDRMSALLRAERPEESR